MGVSMLAVGVIMVVIVVVRRVAAATGCRVAVIVQVFALGRLAIFTAVAFEQVAGGKFAAFDIAGALVQQ